MSDINLNGPDLKLVRTRESVPARPAAPPAGADKTSMPVDKSAARAIPLQEVARNEQLKASQEAERQQLDAALTRLNDFVQTVQRDLHFEVDRDTGKALVRVIDRQTQEVIRQIPDEVALRLAEKLQQDEPLTLFNIKV